MKLTVSKTAFLKELNLIQGVVERKNTIPILSNLLIESDETGITIKGTDLDVSISTHCNAEVQQPGSCCVPAKKLFEIVKSLPEAEIEISSNESQQILITCERSKFKLIGLAKEHFPVIATHTGLYVPLQTSLMSTFINRTIFAITNEESRYALSGTKFELSEASVRMVATDGHRLSFIEKQGQFFQGEKIDILIPRKTLAELAKLCSDSNGIVEFAKSDTHLFFKVDQRLLSSRTLSGQFPNYELVLPKDKRTAVHFENLRLSSAIKRVSLMADEKSHSVKFELTTGQTRISSQAADVGESEDVLSVEYNGEPFTIGFNAQYLLDFFSVISEGEVIFDVKDGNSQVQLRSAIENEFDFRYIVMPMRL